MYIPSLTQTLCYLSMIAAGTTFASPQPVEKALQIPRPTLKGIFTANVQLGPLLGVIPIPGGVRALQATVNGTVTGDIKGKVTGGLAYPYFNGTVFHFSNILLYGVTDDGFSFLVRQVGAGTAQRQITQLTIEIGGKYAYFQDEFLLASVTIPANTSMAIVEVFVVA